MSVAFGTTGPTAEQVQSGNMTDTASIVRQLVRLIELCEQHGYDLDSLINAARVAKASTATRPPLGA